MENLQVLRRWKTTIHSNIPNIRTQFSTYHSIEGNTWLKHSQSFTSFEARRKLKAQPFHNMKNNNNLRRKVKGRNQIHKVKFLYKSWTSILENWNQHFYLSQHLNSSKQQSVCCGEWKWQETREQVTSDNHKDRNQQTTMSLKYLALLSFVLPILLLSEATADQSEVRVNEKQ